MTVLEEDFRRLADALGEQVAVPPFARVQSRLRRRRTVRFAVPALAAAAVATVAVGAVVTRALQAPPAATGAGATAGPTAGHSFALAEPAPSCRSAEVRASFTAARTGAGREVGRIAVSGPATPCSPGNAVTVSAVAGNRVVLTRAALAGDALSPQRRLAIALVLPAGTATACATADRVRPTALTVTLASGAQVAVAGDLSGLATCGGRLAVGAVGSTPSPS